MSQDAERELLFGVLALQNNFIDRRQLLAAFDRWVHDKRQPLGSILLEDLALTADEYSLLTALAEKYLEKHLGHIEQSLATCAALESVHAELSQLGDRDLFNSVNRVATASWNFLKSRTRDGEETSQSLFRVSNANRARFCILRPHARGGLGEVFVAEDEELHRQVALKQIQERHAHDPSSRARFVLEAEITGGLEHPGVVPIYGLGEYPDGRPFYAMRLIHGESFQEAIARFHGQSPRVDVQASPLADTAGGREPTDAKPDPPPAANPLPSDCKAFVSREFRQLLGRFVDVCQAVEYAHSRGVLHRDLKPGNVMLGKYGETLVVDWGLAKVIGRREQNRSSPEDEATLRPPSTDEGEATRVGTTLGTPSYMSPEQAAGRLDQLGAASDVYSLGAILYCLLTGRPPYRREDNEPLGDLLRRVERGELPSPQQINRDIPKPLAAICLKAMAHNPRQRYASVRALADEIERWLADEPVFAHADSRSERLARWSRRHRRSVQVGVLALLAVTIISTAATLVVQSALRTAQADRDTAKHALTLEADAGKDAKEAIDHYVSTVARADVLKDPRLQPLRLELLRDAMTYYRKLVVMHRNDALARKNVAGAIYTIARVHDDSGALAEALEAYRTALKEWEQLSAENPDDHEYLRLVSIGYNDTANVQGQLGDVDAQMENYQRAMAIRRRLLQLEPDNRQFQRHIADSHHNIANVKLRQGRLDEAFSDVQQAIKIEELLCDDIRQSGDRFPYYENAAYHRDRLAGSYENAGAIERERGEWQGALAWHQKALKLREQLVSESPENLDLQINLAITYENIGDWHLAQGPREAAIENFQKALTIGKAVNKEKALSTRGRALLARSFASLGRVYREDGRRADAISSLEASAAIFESLGEDIGDPSKVYDAACMVALCLAASESGDPGVAPRDELRRQQLVDRAVELLQKAIAKGFSDLERLKSDSDLDSIRRHPEYQSLLEEMQRNRG